MTRYANFKPETRAFLDELAANNNREWFKEHKPRYEEQVLDVALNFIQSMQDPLADIAPHFVAQATRMGGSTWSITLGPSRKPSPSNLRRPSSATFAPS